MPKVVFAVGEGTRTTIDARVGSSVMLTATRNGLCVEIPPEQP